MSVIELKLQIINRLSTIDDEQVLEEILKLVNFESDLDAVYQLTDAEKKAIDAGLKDVKEGKVYSSEEADMMMNKWLRK